MFYFDWEDISNTRDSVSSAIQTPRISSKSTPLRVVVSVLFSVFGYPDETLSLVFDMSQLVNLYIEMITLNSPKEIVLCYRYEESPIVAEISKSSYS